MNTLQALLNSAFVDRLGITLLHSLWQGAAILLLLWIALSLLRGAAARIRYGICCCALLMLLAIPLITLLVITPPMPTANAANTAMIATATSGTPAVSIADGAPAMQPAAFTDHPTESVTSADSFERFSYRTALPWIVATWIAGVVVLVVWNFGAWIAVQNLRRTSVASVPPEVEALGATLCRRLRITRTIRILSSTLARTPMVIGTIKPVILLPIVALTELSMAELESIIAHELAHIRRHDYLINLLQAAVETVLFYHPAAWLISSRMRQEREHCCDDLALSVTRDRASYVRALAAVASIRVTSLVPAASGGMLLPRLQRLLGIADATPSRPSRWTTGIAVLGLIIAGGLFTHLQSAAKADDTADPDLVWIHGHVLDPDGKPVAAAKIKATGYSFKEPIAEAVSDADGSYKISYRKSMFADLRFDQSTVVVAAIAPQFGPGWAKADHAAADGELALKLAKDDVPLDGRLIDNEGTPVAGARVRVWSIHARPTDLNQLNIMRFDIAELPGDIPPDLDAVVLGDARWTTTDKDGRFHITGVGRDRTIDLMFTGKGIASGFLEVNSQPAPAQTRDFQSYVKVTSTVFGSKFDYIVQPGRIVTGKVTNAVTHAPVAGVKLERGRVGEEVITDAQGRYEFTGVGKSDRFAMTAVPPPSEPYFMSDIDEKMTPGNDPMVIDIELHRGVVITGRVTNMTTGKPVRPMQVQYLPLLTNNAAKATPEFRRSQIPGRFSSYHSKGDGTFRIVGLPGAGVVVTNDCADPFCNGAGKEFLKCPLNKNGGMAVYGAGFGPMSYIAVKDVDIAETQQQAAIDLQCNPGATVSLNVVDGDGKPVDGALVFRDSPSQPTRRLKGSTVDVVALGPTEKRSVQFLHRGRLIGKVVSVSVADIPSRKLTVQLEPLSTISGRLIGRDKQPLANALVQGSMEELLPTGTDNDGKFKLMLISGRAANIRGVKGFEQFLTDARNLVIPPGETKDLGDVHVN